MWEVLVIDLSNFIKADPFKETVKIIEKVLNKGEVDMLINIEPDYLFCQQDKSIFLNLQEHKINTHSTIDNYINIINEDEKICFLPSCIDNTRFLFVNCSLMEKLKINMDLNKLSFDQFLHTLKEISAKIGEYNSDIFMFSFGSPIDEYFFDDIDKCIQYLDCKKNKPEKYAEEYVKMAKIAKDYSYTRDDIGHAYPMDSYFISGKVLFKIITLYELQEFNLRMSLRNYKNNKFAYKILPFPRGDKNKHLNNSDVRLMCISSNTKYKTECLEVIDFLYSSFNGLKTIDGNNPIANNSASIPLNNSTEIIEEFKRKYGVGNILYGDSFCINYFIKNSDKYWKIVKLKRKVLLEYLKGKITDEQLFFKIKLLMEEYYAKEVN